MTPDARPVAWITGAAGLIGSFVHAASGDTILISTGVYYEVYLNDPSQQPSQEPMTQLVLPLKG